MRQPVKVEDQDMKWVRAQWEKTDRLFWGKVTEVLRGLVIGVEIGIASVLLITGHCLFLLEVV